MRSARPVIVTAAATFLLGVNAVVMGCQGPVVRAADESQLREYVGTYERATDKFVCLQLWSELTGTNQLVAFDESGQLRALYPTDRDAFFVGPGAAVPTSVEARIKFLRDGSGKINALTWQRERD